jgi:hypothetical protein
VTFLVARYRDVYGRLLAPAGGAGAVSPAS